MAEVSFLRLHETVDDFDFDFDQEEILAFDSGFRYCPHAFCTDSNPISLNDHHIHHTTDDLYPDDPYDQIGGSSGSEVIDRENQVSFVMDLLQQRVEQSQAVEIGGFELESVLESGFGVVERREEEIGGNSVGLELGEVLGLGLGAEFDEEDDKFGGFIVSDCGDEFYVSRRESGSNSGGSANGGRDGDGDGINRFSGGLNVVDFESDSDDDADELLGNRLLHLEDDFASPSRYNDDNIDLCWDSLQLDDHRDGNEEFEWEDVDEGLYVMNPEEPIALHPLILPEEDEINEVQQVGSRATPWEVLLNERNLMMESNDDYIDTLEDEMTFGQFTEVEEVLMGKPPASKLAVESLPVVSLTEADVQNGNALCAVCKDEMGVGDKAKQLPCSHRYHGECILPWLEIRNSCPVCRHELPTDDPDYELRRNQRAARDQ